jgi:hypothetical protein
MTTPLRQLVLLTTYRPSSKYRVSLSREEADAFLNGYLALWHPAVVSLSAEPPTFASHYEFETPTGNHLFAVPEIPPSYQPEEWSVRQREAGSLTFAAKVSWTETLSALGEALGVAVEDSEAGCVPFLGLGLGYLILEAFVDAQDHVNPLDKTAFYGEVRQAALAECEKERLHALGQAAHLLHQAREVVYPSQLYQAVSIFLDGDPAEATLDPWLQGSLAVTLIGTANWMREWVTKRDGRREMLQARAAAGQLDFWGGPDQDQEDALLPAAAWMANLQRGLREVQALLGKRLESYGRRRFAVTATLPTVLQPWGLKRSLGFSFDGGAWPHAPNGLTAWRGPDGQLVECCNRKPEPLDEPATAFHLGLILYEATTADYVGWIHLGLLKPTGEMPVWFRAWTALHKLAPVFGTIGTLESAIREIPATEQYTPPNADDFQSDYLLDLTGQGHVTTPLPNPVSRFQHAARQWRQWEVARTLHALWSILTPAEGKGANPVLGLSDQLLDGWNSAGTPGQAAQLVESIASRLAERLMRSSGPAPGYLLFNPCSFTRKIAVRLPAARTLLPAPAWASQASEGGVEAVIETPPLGFAWVPRAVEKGAKVRMPKQAIVEGNSLRNEFLHVEVDPVSGGIKSIRDSQKLLPRIGQQLVYAPGGAARCREVKVTHNGLAFGEIVTSGDLIDVHDQVLARFVQRVRLYAGRKAVEVQVRLEPIKELLGYPWHAYYASRWAWRDPQTRVSKSVHATLLSSSHTRPETPGFIELDMPQGRTAIFSRGLPFWQRHGQRMIDTLLLVEGETVREFDLAVSVDDELPHLTEQDLNTPALVVPTEKGPPTAGTSSWLFFLDAPSVRIESIGIDTERVDSVIVHLVETFGYATEALLQCPRTPTAAALVDAWGEVRRALTLRDDGVNLHLGCYESQYVRVSFGV